MTHNDIYTKFLIEYDKANVTSSYPSLTEYEAATILDKAYLALIARKLTGNNTRQIPFEYDTKAVEDLRPLVVSAKFDEFNGYSLADNEHIFKINDDLLYYLEGQLMFDKGHTAADNKSHKKENVLPVNHNIAQKFRATNSNLPWIKIPVSFIENDFVHVLIDSYKHKDDSIEQFLVTYLKKPARFIDSLIYDEPGGDDPNIPDDPGSEGDNDFILDQSLLDSNDKIR